MRAGAAAIVLLGAAAAAAAAAVAADGLARSSPAPVPQSAVSGPHDWPMYQRVPSHNAVVAAPGLRANWVARTGDKINGGLALVDGTLYAVSFDKKLYAFDAATGAVRWTAGADDILMSTPVVQSGLVVVGSGHNGFLKPDDYTSQIWGRPEGNTVYAFSTDGGHAAWSFHTVGQDMPSPAIADGIVSFANGDLHAYGLTLNSGAPVWQTALPGVSTMASATVENGVVYVSTCHNAPYVCETRALDVRTGKTIWSNSNGGSDCSPALGDGLVYVNANRDEKGRFRTGGVTVIAAIDARTGKTRWTHTSDPGPYTFPASNERQIAGTYDRDTLYQPIGSNSEIVALDARTGTRRWKTRTWAPVKMSPVIAGNDVYFGDTAGVLYRVDRTTGHIKHATSFLQPFATSPPIIAGDTIFIADGSMIVAMPLGNV